MEVTPTQRAIWQRVVSARRKRDAYHHQPRAIILRRQYKRQAKAESGTHFHLVLQAFILFNSFLCVARRRDSARRQEKVFYDEPEDMCNHIEQRILHNRAGECAYTCA